MAIVLIGNISKLIMGISKMKDITGSIFVFSIIEPIPIFIVFIRLDNAIMDSTGVSYCNAPVHYRYVSPHLYPSNLILTTFAETLDYSGSDYHTDMSYG